MSRAAAKTAPGPTTLVAIEQHFPKHQRIIDDDLAYRILPLGMRTFVRLLRPAPARDWMVRATEKGFPGIWGGVMCRKRYIDEKLIESAGGQIDAVVNLGAGFDTRAYRLPALADLAVWEIDQAENIEPKRARLRKLRGDVPAHVNLVSIDFDREELGAVLATHGYSSEARTFFIWEAVTQYLTETGILTTLDFLARAARGSRLAFTYCRKDFLEGRVMYAQERLYRKYVRRDRAWHFGMDPDEVANVLGEYGWGLAEHLGYEELAGRYVTPTGRDLASTPLERIAYAKKS